MNLALSKAATLSHPHKEAIPPGLGALLPLRGLLPLVPEECLQGLESNCMWVGESGFNEKTRAYCPH